MYVCMYMEILPAHISVHHMYAWCQRGEKRTMYVRELELQMFVSHKVGASRSKSPLGL